MQELDFAVGLAKEAGNIALSYFGKAPEYWHKDNDQGRVSVADLEVDQYICDAIAQRYPDDAILSEERADDAERLSAKRVWIIDPIDGTEAYLNGQDFFSISIALIENNVTVMGVVYAPAHERMYTAVKGSGAFLNGEPIRISGVVEGAKILASGASYNQELIRKEPPLNLHFRPSVAYRLAMIAEGYFDGTFALRKTWEWDIAAGDLLVTEAGGVMVDRHGNRPEFNQDIAHWNGMIAGSSKLVQDLLERIT